MGVRIAKKMLKTKKGGVKMLSEILETVLLLTVLLLPVFSL